MIERVTAESLHGVGFKLIQFGSFQIRTRKVQLVNKENINAGKVSHES